MEFGSWAAQPRRRGNSLRVRQGEQGGIMQRQQLGGSVSCQFKGQSWRGWARANRRGVAEPEDQDELDAEYEPDHAPPTAVRPGSRFNRRGGHGGERGAGAA